VALGNSMSAGLGVLDLTIPVSLTFAVIVNWSEQKSRLNHSDLQKHILWLLITLSLIATVLSVANSSFQILHRTGYSWWGIAERGISSHMGKDIFIWRREHVPGENLMNPRQLKFALDIKELSKNRKSLKLMAVPNIPYFYELTGVAPYCKTPIIWIDVTNQRKSEEFAKCWNNHPPNLIIATLQPQDTYESQTKAFSQNGVHIFNEINKAIVSDILSGDLKIMAMYNNDDSTYLTLALEGQPKSSVKLGERESTATYVNPQLIDWGKFGELQSKAMASRFMTYYQTYYK
jgi:hypothetical protein